MPYVFQHVIHAPPPRRRLQEGWFQLLRHMAVPTALAASLGGGAALGAGAGMPLAAAGLGM